jgi:F0F1-type ATP synthase beta subunit
MQQYQVSDNLTSIETSVIKHDELVENISEAATEFQKDFRSYPDAVFHYLGVFMALIAKADSTQQMPNAWELYQEVMRA